MSGPEPRFVITGRHVLAAFVLFFAIVIAVNVVFVRLAVSSFPGEQVEKSYYQGLNYNEVLDNRARQADGGWRIALTAPPLAGERSSVEVRLVDADGGPVYRARVTGELVRPTTDLGRQELVFYPLSDGLYRADAAALDPGAWDLALKGYGEGESDPRIEATTRIVIE